MPIYPLEVIVKKRQGRELTPQEISFVVDGFTEGKIPDYQMAAWLMAICWRGLSFAETNALTRTLIASGERIDLADLPGIKVDKHSTGGVGDKTTLVVVPLVASIEGATVVKMSGRSLGHTGGTIDKLESIPGFRTDLNLREVKAAARRIGAVIAGQSADLVPADKKIYALRDVTGTVDSLPLIASSIISKKIAGGADRIVIDVKVGSGALLPELECSRELASWMVALGKELGRPVVAVLSNMEQPLGRAVGNALEVAEAIAALHGQGPDDLTELSLFLGSRMLLAAELTSSQEEGRMMLRRALTSGRALAKLKEMIANQGGDPAVADNPSLLPLSSRLLTIRSEQSGYVTGIDARSVGAAAQLLGAGRLRQDDQIDPAAGIELLVKVGGRVSAGDRLAELHYNSSARLSAAADLVKAAYHLGSAPPEPQPLIYGLVDR